MKSLKEAYKDYFPIGVAINNDSVDTHRELIMEQFNSITAENEMKFESVHPKEATYTFEKADKIADFAISNGMKLRGHTFVWHNMTPDWVFTDSNGNEAGRELLLERMKEHIKTVMKRYAGRTYCWDVVNEAMTESAEEPYRKSNWYKIIGEDYIEQAYIFAHEADPTARLFYNDYYEWHDIKRENIIKMLGGLIKKGIPIHGVGLQGHWHVTKPKLEEIIMTIERFAKLGLELQITELDISVGEEKNVLEDPTREMLEKQAIAYENVFKIFREYKDIIRGITFWGVSDEISWLNDFPKDSGKEWPLLFDRRKQPKDAFRRVVEF